MKYCDLAMGLENPACRTGDTLVSLWINVAGIPCCIMTDQGITAMDEAGILPLTIRQEEKSGFPVRCWVPARDTVGDVALICRFYPREVPPDYHFRPFYDFRNENLGVTYFREVMNGRIIPPNKDWFGGRFRIIRDTITDPVRGTVVENGCRWISKENQP